ncbi:MAG: hypothetical protein GF408_03850 [Candidatus Omnitrophica bacterium]|nr:hypothetical protein [Candidatus Omnitrophota bacterium]
MTGIKRTGNPLMKMMSVLLIFTFMFYNTSFAVPEADIAPPEAADVSARPLLSEEVGVSIDAGTVKSRYDGESGKMVVHIQDAHCNYEAQSNINRILEQLTKECGINIISVEGAEGIVDTTWFKAFPDEEIRKEVATYFMKKGEITGAEFFSITSDFNGTIFGSETRDYYIKNLKAFTEVYPYKDMIEKYFQNTGNIANRLKSVIYTPGLREVDSKIREFDGKGLELSDYAAYLSKKTRDLRIDNRDYPNFGKLEKTLEYEDKIDFDIVDSERSEYIDLLSKTLSKKKMTELVGESIRFKKGHIKAVDFYTYLRELAKEHDIDMVHKFPNLFYYYIYTKLYEGIDNEKLFREIDLIETALKEKLFTSGTERKLDKYSSMLDMYVNLVNIELTNDDYDRLKAYQKEFTLSDVMSFLKSMVDKYGMNYAINGVPAQISSNMPRMIDFYEIAMKRDKALIDNTLNFLSNEDNDRCVLIAGGFHTRGIKKMLEAKGISYVVVTPKITKDVETPYIKVLTNQRTSLEDIITESAAMPGAKLSEEAPAAARAKFLGAQFRCQLVDMYLADDPELAEMAYLEDALSDREVAEDVMKGWVRENVDRWVSRMEKTVPEDLWKELSGDKWMSLSGAYLMLCEKAAENLGKPLDDRTKAVISGVFEDRFSPGSEHVKRGTQDSLTPEEVKAMDSAIKETLDAMEAAGIPRSRIEVPNEATGGVFVVLDDEIYAEAAGKYNAPGDVECHPGTRRSRLAFARGEIGYEDVEKRFYIRRSLFDKLSPGEKDTFAAHEELHIRIALGLVDPAEIAKFENEEAYVNHQIGADIRPIMASLGSVSHIEDLLREDVKYGSAAREHIESERGKIAALRATGDPSKTERAEALEDELEDYAKGVYTRRINLDRMQSVLTDKDYPGYDVIIVSSSTPEEVEAQQKALDKLFEGRSTDNAAMNNRVCVISALDDSEGGQIIGQFNTWRDAGKRFAAWAERNGLEETDLDSLVKSGDIKVAVYHNGGKGERASPATQALQNSRAKQKVVGKVKTAAKGEEVDIELMAGVVLSTAPLALSNDGSRIDTFWANQMAYGTLDFSELTRTNYHFDKFVIKVPEDPKKKDLFDYGTAVIGESGQIQKFLANKVLTRKNDETGLYEDNPDYAEEMRTLMEAPKGVFDFGSFSMGREMHYALMDYWTNVKNIFDVIDSSEDNKAGMSRDIDPALVQVIVPLANALSGKELPDLPDPETLRSMRSLERDEEGNIEMAAEKKAELMEAYGKLMSVIDDADAAAAIEKIYNNPEKQDFVLESIEFFILYNELFSDMDRVVGHIDMGENSHWFAYKRILDLSNEKFYMLSDIIGANQQIGPDGSVVMTDLSPDGLDAIRAEDARRMRGITNEEIAVFLVNGERIALTADQVKQGWRDEENDIEVRNSVIQGVTVLLPGSRVVNSVVNDSQGKIIAENSYIETTTAREIEAENSIVYYAVDPGTVRADKTLIADAFRPDIEDPRFGPGHTRMEAPIGYDPKGKEINDKTLFGTNVYTFKQVRDFSASRGEVNSEDLQKAARSDVFYDIVDRRSWVNLFKDLKFGTSGLRALVYNPGYGRDEEWLSDMDVYISTRGFIRFLRSRGDELVPGQDIAVGGDLRDSTPRIMYAVMQAVEDMGYKVDFVGRVPSPALAYYAMQKGIPSIMVTGSHIPDDRNGVKFTKKSGEVLKSDEKEILANVDKEREEEYSKTWAETKFNEEGLFKEPLDELPPVNDEAVELYVKRYAEVFTDRPLEGETVVLYKHSAVGKDIIQRIFEALGADVRVIAESESFVPVDTEKISDRTYDILAEAAKQEPFAIISTDGDSDRPLLADGRGKFLPGDKLGALVSMFLEPDFAAFPVSTNPAVAKSLSAEGVEIEQTKIGSPYVIAAMNEKLEQDPEAKVVAWEANGGFLTGSDWQINGNTLKALPTRDAALPLIAAMLLAKREGKTVAELIDDKLPPFATAAGVIDDNAKGTEDYTSAMGKDIVRNFSPENPDITEVSFDASGNVEAVKGAELTPDIEEEMREIRNKLSAYFNRDRGFGEIVSVNFLDGVRMTFLTAEGKEEIYHIRPSGNAPEFRNYTAAETEERAKEMAGLRFQIVPQIVRDMKSPGAQAVRRNMPRSDTPLGKVVQAILAAKPVFLKPYLHLKVWGVNGVGEYCYGIEKGDDSSTASAEGEEASLEELVDLVPEELLGKGVVENFGASIPLVKILTPKSRLSVQFHDSKNELWIITGIDEETAWETPSVIIGFSEESVERYGDEVTEAYREALERYGDRLNSLAGMMVTGGYKGLLDEQKDIVKAAEWAVERNGENFIHNALERLNEAREDLEWFYNYREVKVGDVVSIPAGTLHAAGPGLEILEPQIPGPTQSLEDGSTWPVRYAFPKYTARSPEATKTLDVGRAAEMIPDVALPDTPEVVMEEEGLMMERMPGGFADKGLEVRRISLEKGKELSISEIESFHSLVTVEGRARAIIGGVSYDIPAATPDGEMMVIPSTVDTLTIVADEDAQIIDTFSPVPALRRLEEPIRSKENGIAGTASEERLVFADFGTTVSSLDELYIIDEMAVPEVISPREHVLTVKEGSVDLVRSSDGKVIAELEEGERYVVPEGFDDYIIVRTGTVKNAVVRVDYQKTDIEEIAYSVYNMVKKHLKEIRAGQIDLFLPQQMFADSGVGSASWMEKFIQEYISETIRIETYNPHGGLSELAKKSINKGAVGILVAPKSNIDALKDLDEDTDLYAKEIKEFLYGEKGTLRTLAIPDIHKDSEIDNKGWFFNREVIGTALTLATVKPEQIRELTVNEHIDNAAADLRKILAQLTGRSVPPRYLYYLLSRNEIEDQLEALPAQFRDDTFGWLAFLVNNLLLKMPIKPFDPSDQLEQRRKVMWSV